MKKIIIVLAILLTVLIIISLSGCGSSLCSIKDSDSKYLQQQLFDQQKKQNR